MHRQIFAVLAFFCAAAGIEAADSSLYLYSVWHPAVVYARGGSTTTLEVFTAPGVKSVTLLFGSGSSADRFPLYDDGTHSDKRAKDSVFTLGGISYRLGVPMGREFSDYLAELEIVRTDGSRETATPATLGIIEQKPGQNWQPVQARADAWVTDYGIFLKDDGRIFPGFPNCGTTIGRGNTEAFRRLYEVFPDDFDFVTVMPAKNLHDPSKKCDPAPYAVRVKCEVRNIGQNPLDNTAMFHSQGRLKTVIFHSFGIPQILDHEIGHAWGAHLGKSLGLSDEQGHWVAYAAPYCQMSSFPALEIEGQNSDGSYRIRKHDSGTVERGFNDLMLYSMGLIDKKEVKPFFLLKNRNQRDWNRVPKSDFDIFTVDQIARADGGPRAPAYPQTPRKFTMAFVFVSNEDFAPAEFDYFSRLAKWFGSEEPDYYNGMTFKNATRGKGTMITRLPVDKIKKAPERGQAVRPSSPPEKPEEPQATAVSGRARTGESDSSAPPRETTSKSRPAARPEGKSVNLIVKGAGVMTAGSQGTTYVTETSGGKTKKKLAFQPGGLAHCSATVANLGGDRAAGCAIVADDLPAGWLFGVNPYDLAPQETKHIDIYVNISRTAPPGEYTVKLRASHRDDHTPDDNLIVLRIRVAKP